MIDGRKKKKKIKENCKFVANEKATLKHESKITTITLYGMVQILLNKQFSYKEKKIFALRELFLKIINKYNNQ